MSAWPAHSAARPPHEPPLDGLRGLAILAVILVHGSSRVFPGGWIGVDAFFVLSGFLITRILAAELDRAGRIDLRRFFLRRFARLGPALLAVIAVETAWTLLTSPDPRHGLVEAALAGGYVMNWSQAFGWFPALPLSHTWSLAAEEQFYLLWPLLLPLLPRRARLPVLLAGALAAATWRNVLLASGAPFDRLYFGFDTHCDTLLIGCALALAPIPPRWADRAARWVAVPLLVLVAITALFAWPTTFAMSGGITLAGLMAAWLLVAARSGSWLSPILSTPALVHVGRISYGWYLYHLPIREAFRHVLPDGPGIELLLCAAAYPVAVLSYRWLEVPAQRWLTGETARPGLGSTHDASEPIHRPGRDKTAVDLQAEIIV